jgi:hypothetical protein
VLRQALGIGAGAGGQRLAVRLRRVRTTTIQITGKTSTDEEIAKSKG